MPAAAGQGPAPAVEEDGHPRPPLTLTEAMHTLATAEMTIPEIAQLLAQVRPSVPYDEAYLTDQLPRTPSPKTIRQGVLRMLGHVRDRREEAEQTAELDRREAAWRAATGKGRRRRTSKRKHFRKRTSRRS